MSVEAEIQVGQLNQAITAPSSAIVRQQDGSTGVYVVGQAQTLVLQPIQIGTTMGDRTEIKSGLTGNEQVLISFPPGMEPAARVPGPLGALTGGNRNSRSSGSSTSSNGGGNNPSPPPSN